MEAHKHPEYGIERIRLEKTQEAIDNFIQGKNYTRKVGADDWANDSIKVYNANIRQEYVSKRASPYFSRVDFQQDEHSIESIYFGYRGLNLGEYAVVEWRAPIGRLMATMSKRQKIKVPEGSISGDLMLRRRFKIDGGKITAIADEVDRRFEFSATEIISNEDFLIEEISSRGDPLLKDIVKTIQEQQDDIIRAPYNKIIIINGVAGSGKTSIALHRLAYLLFPDNETTIRPSYSIVFCPNQIFLDYISDLLPNLGEKDVIQTTFLDWALQRMIYAELNNIVVQDSVQRKFLDENTDVIELEMLRQNSRAKGKLEFEQVLENYVRKKISDIKAPKRNWTYRNLGELNITLSVKKEEINSAITDITEKKMVLEKIREEVFATLQKCLEDSYDRYVWATVNDLKSKFEVKQAARFQSLAFSNKMTKRAIVQLGLNNLRKDFNEWWPPTNIVKEYYGLLANKDMLASVAVGVLTEREIDALTHATISDKSIEYEDIPALYYFYRLVYTEYKELYDHIVIDEAQDFSPMQFDILRKCSRNLSMTIVGDVAQGIHSYRGISKWEDLESVFPSGSVQFENITQSYRSSKEIVDLSNAILRKMYKDNALFAKALGRSAGKPIIRKESNREKLKLELLNEIKRLQRTYKHIAILVKSNAECEEIGEFLKDCNVVSTYPISDTVTGFIYSGGLVVLPVALSKGIEFEAVIIFNVNNDEYNFSKEYDGHLLYVATTRALHHLSILFAGVISSYLENIDNLVDNQN